MRKTKFTLWLEELDGLQKKLHDVHSLSDVSETITIDGKILTFNLGKEYNVETSDASYPIAVRHLRPLYTNNKEEFDALLESLKQSTETVVEATDTILTAISAEAVPGAVMARLKGEQVSGESPDLVTDMAERKLRELQKLFQSYPLNILDTYSGKLLVAEREFIFVNYGTSEIVVDISYGNNCAAYGAQSRVRVTDVEQAMYFIANYGVIKTKVQSLLDQLKAIKV